MLCGGFGVCLLGDGGKVCFRSFLRGHAEQVGDDKDFDQRGMVEFGIDDADCVHVVPFVVGRLRGDV